MSDQHPSNPPKPKLTSEQRESQILDMEIKIDNANVAIKQFKKERLDIRQRLADLDVREAAKKAEIAETTKAMAALADPDEA